MAVNMSKKDQDAIKAAQSAYTAAQARGDKAGMDAAHKQAESIRSGYGYSGGKDGSQYIPKSGSSSGASGGGGGSGSSKSTSSYTPIDNSGRNYAQLSGMTQADQATLSSLQAAYTAAQARGDKAAMDAAHQAAEALRAGYNYSGGSDGSQWIDILNPGLYAPRDPQREIGGQGGGAVNSFTYENAPSYQDKYESQIDDLLNQILNRDAFSYNALEDPLYRQYQEQYSREGDRAMQNTLGQLSARTGGLASSWAGTAAQQQNDYYASMAADKIPELYQLAYSMYMDGIDDKVRDLGLLEQLSGTQYNRYRDTMADWRNDRSFAYNKYRDDVADQRYGDETAYNRGVYQDETAYNRGLYQSETAYNRALEKAKTLAALGDFSGYQALGYSPEEIARMQGAYALTQTPVYSGGGGRGSSGGGGGGNSQPAQEDDIYQTLYDAGVRTEGDAYAKLLGMGYTSGVAGKIASYFAERMDNSSPSLSNAPGGREKGKMNDAYFRAMMTSISTALRQGRAEDVTSGLDGAWESLSQEQRNKLQNLLGQYGYQYTGD